MSAGFEKSSPLSRGERFMHLLAAFSAGAVAALAYSLPLWKGLVYASQDTTDLNYVMVRFFVERVRQGDFSGWVPELGTGFNLFSDPTFGFFAVKTIFFFLFPGYSAQAASIIFSAFLAGLGGYALGFSLTRSVFPSLLAALAWPLCGPVASMVKNAPYLFAAPFLPFAFASWEGFSSRIPRALLTGLFMGLAGLSGDLFAPCFLLCGFFLSSVFSKRPEDWTREFTALLAAGMVAAGLCSISWMPALFALPDSARASGLSPGEALSFSLHPARFLNLVAPRFFGLAAEGSFWGAVFSSSRFYPAFWCDSTYLSLALPGLVAVGIFRGDRRKFVSFLVVAGFFLFFSLGRWNPAAVLIFSKVPGVSFFRYPAKLFMFSSLFLVGGMALAAAGLRDWMEEGFSPRRAGFFSFALYGALFAAAAFFAGEWGELLRKASKNPGLSFLRVEQDLVRLGIAALVAPVFIFLASRKLRPGPCLFFLVAAAGFDLFTALPSPGVSRLSDLERGSRIGEFIRSRGPGRLVVADDIYYYARAGRRDALFPNWPLVEGIPQCFGKSAALPGLVKEQLTRDNLAARGEGLLRTFAGRFILAALDPFPPWLERMELKGEAVEAGRFPESNLVLYESARIFPELFLSYRFGKAGSRKEALFSALSAFGEEYQPRLPVDCGLFKGKLFCQREEPPALGPYPEESGGRILERERQPGGLRVRIESSGRVLLVARFYPLRGLRAFVDGEEARIWFVDGVSAGVVAPPGRREVEFRFRSPGLGAGAAISGATLICLIVAAWAFRISGRRRRN